MKPALACLLLSSVAIVVSACGNSQRYPAAPDLGVRIPSSKPPSPAVWPSYPHFSQRSCWERPFQKAILPIVLRVAPSYTPRSRRHVVAPETVARRLLTRLGDQRYIRSIRFRPAPRAVGQRVHFLYAGGHPPRNALAAEIAVDPAESEQAAHSSPQQSLNNALASWEVNLIGGALRDDLCSAGGPPLVFWAGAGSGGLSTRVFALEQRFPNPSPSAFRRRVALVGKRYGFRIVSLRLLRPRQLAPLLVVGTSRPRKAFVHDIPAILRLLDPTSTVGHKTALSFEGFFFAAEDAHGPFVSVQSASRGVSENSEWSSDPCDYPYQSFSGQQCSGKG